MFRLTSLGAAIVRWYVIVLQLLWTPVFLRRAGALHRVGWVGVDNANKNPLEPTKIR